MSGYDSPNHMSGYTFNRGQYADQGYVSTAHGPENPGTNPRYVPPQRRPLTFGAMPAIERPESAMSSISFVSQALGGVSLNDLYAGHAAGAQSAGERENVDVAGGIGARRGFTGRLTQSAIPGAGGESFIGGAGGQAPAMGGKSQDQGMQHRWNGAVGLGGVASIPVQSGLADGLGGRAGYGAFGSGPQGSYAPGGQSTMGSPLTPMFNPNHGLPTFGAIGSAVSRNPAMPFAPSPDSLADSARGGSSSLAFDLAQLIRSGAADPGDDDTNDPLTGRGSARARARDQPPPPPSVTMPMHRSSRSTADATRDPAYIITLIASRESNTLGNAAAFLAVEPQPYPDYFAHLSRGIKPTLEEFFMSMPVIEPCRIAVASNAGVVRIRNIPFTTPRSEITAFVGRNAQIVAMPQGAPYFAVHVIMERHTGKTMDAFIEFSRGSEAQYVVTQFNKRMSNGRHPRLGDRHVEVEISSQEDLMSELFPRAQNVHWEGCTPRILANNEMYYQGVPAAGFTGFLQSEEIVMVIKHAETPHRSPFAQRAIIRVFESHISTLHKYPWFANECVKMTERRLLFDATMALAKFLIIHLRKYQGQHSDTTKPTNATLQEFTVAALTCPGFSEQQKHAYIQQLLSGGFGAMASSRGMNLKYGGDSDLAAHWPFQVLARAPGAQEDVVLYFASLMREATMNGRPLSLVEQHRMRAYGGNVNGSAFGPFGNINIDYGNANTVGEVGEIELRTIEQLLNRVLPRSRAPSDA
ncbi:hypothetical protein LTR53_010156 [Teratosphaeriaceae sp. CCFEE 6253]|nr:hypothetical protein LTR53_010156 [Teratosphaeriaceae sp. CCFEE 6253]